MLPNLMKLALNFSFQNIEIGFNSDFFDRLGVELTDLNHLLG